MAALTFSKESSWTVAAKDKSAEVIEKVTSLGGTSGLEKLMKEFSISREEIRAMGLFIHRKKTDGKKISNGKWMCSIEKPPETEGQKAAASSVPKPEGKKKGGQKPVKKTGGGGKGGGGKGGKSWGKGGKGWQGGGGGGNGDMKQMLGLLKVLVNNL